MISPSYFYTGKSMVISKIAALPVLCRNYILKLRPEVTGHVPAQKVTKQGHALRSRNFKLRLEVTDHEPALKARMGSRPKGSDHDPDLKSRIMILTSSLGSWSRPSRTKKMLKGGH